MGDLFDKNTGQQGARAANQANQLGIDELRRQFDTTQGNIQPFVQAGQEALPGVQAGGTLAGFSGNLSDIFNTDIFKTLVDERTRATQGQLAAGGLTRSGTAVEEIANIPTNVGLGIEQTLFDRQAGLTGQGLSAAGSLGGFGAQSSGGIASLLNQQGQNTASGLLADQQAKASFVGQLLGVASSAATGFFSDPRLKENVEQVADIGDLGVFEWDWIEKAKDTIVAAFPTLGFMADEVEEKYPHLIHEFGGFKIIDYSALLDELSRKFGVFELKGI